MTTQKEKTERIYAIGRRKTSVARVYIKPGNGIILINNDDAKEYLKRETLFKMVKQPLVLTESLNKYDIYANIYGGGLSSQAGALKLGIARVLVKLDANLRPSLRKAGYLTRDPRMVERKKYGIRGARRRFQFSKR